MDPISSEDAIRLLRGAFEKIERLRLPRHPSVTGVPRARGGLVMHSRYRVDSYTAYKSPKGDAVSLGILLPPEGNATVWVHRRQRRDGRLVTVCVDEYSLDKFEIAAEFYAATAVMLSNAEHSWRDRHPSDLLRSDAEGE